MPRKNRDLDRTFEAFETDGFGQALYDLLDGEQLDLSRAESWQRLATLIAQNWGGFRQTPVATWAMVTKCGEMVLKARLVEKKAGGKDEDEALAELQQLFADIRGVELDPLEMPGEQPANDDEDEDDNELAA